HLDLQEEGPRARHRGRDQGDAGVYRGDQQEEAGAARKTRGGGDEPPAFHKSARVDSAPERRSADRAGPVDQFPVGGSPQGGSRGETALYLGGRRTAGRLLKP